MGDGEPDFGGTLLESEPVFTPEQIREDGRVRVIKTTGQAGIAGAVVTLGAALCRSRGWLHGDLDLVGATAWVTLLSGVTAALTNLSRLRGKS